MFVVDRSGSICNDEAVFSCNNWVLMLDFMDGLVFDLTMGADATRVGVVVYGNQAYVEIKLGEYDSKSDLRDAISEIDYDPNKGTNTSGGILLMREEFHDHQVTSSVTKIAVIITDGKSTRDADDTVPNAEAARDEGIKIVVIGVTESIDEDELRLMSSEPQIVDQNYFASPTFEALDEVMASVTAQICPPSSGKPLMHFVLVYIVLLICDGLPLSGVCSHFLE